MRKERHRSPVIIDALGQAEDNFADMAAVVVTGEGDVSWCGWYCSWKVSQFSEQALPSLAKSTDGEYCGSGRGVPGINLVEILSLCQDKLTHWGGHPVAVGLGLQEENLDSFISHFLETVDKSSSQLNQHSPLVINALVKPNDISFEL